MKRLLALSVVVPVLLIAAACGDDQKANSTDTTAADTSTTAPGSSTTASTTPPTTIGEVTPGVTIVSVSDDLSTKPEVKLEAADTAPTEVVTDDVVVGDGDEVHPGATVEVQYTGMLTNGSEFDSSWSRGQTASFPLSGVIEGWGEGLVGMKVGGRRSLVIPADKGYGDSGSGTIPPGATLVFVVDLVSVTNVDPNGVNIKSVSEDLTAKPEIEIEAVDEWLDGVQTDDVVVGEGDAVPADGDPRLKVQYVGLLRDGTEFDSSWDGDPVEFNLSQVIPGWGEGLRGMKVGGRRTLVIPAELAYGDTGTADGTVPPGSTLVFVVDLIDIV